MNRKIIIRNKAGLSLAYIGGLSTGYRLDIFEKGDCAGDLTRSYEGYVRDDITDFQKGERKQLAAMA